MKKTALLLSLVLLPLATGSAFTNMFDDELRQVDDYSQTHRVSYEEIRGEDFIAEEFKNEGANKLYQKNINEGLETLEKPGIVFGKDCLNWKSCLRNIFWETNGYNRSYLKKQITGNFSKKAFYWIGVKNEKNVSLNGAVSGKEKLARLRNISR